MPSSRRLPSLHYDGTIMLHNEPLPERSITALTLAEFPLTTCPRGMSLPPCRSPKHAHHGLDLGTETAVHEVPPAGLHTGTNRQRAVSGWALYKTAYRAALRVC
jgi:hypothetical protein